MQKVVTLKIAFWIAALTICAFPSAAQCPQMATNCGCATCTCPQTNNTNGCTQTAQQNTPAPAPKAFIPTLSPRAEEYQASDRKLLFADSVTEDGKKKEDKDGSIFGGGPCKNCNKDGSIFGGGPCKTCNKDGSIFGGGPCNGPTCRQIQEKPNPKYIQNYIVYDDSLYNAVHHQCGDLAPLQLEWVDFRIKNGMNAGSYSRNLGKYRFRIFGCRRETKNAVLNEGRILEKDMNFIEIFNDMVSDCYNIVKTPADLCLRTDSPLPEYILTAEITNYYMNLCDEYNWGQSKKEDKRTGSSEMTVVWRLMDLTKTNVLWKGTSTGYGEVEEGEYNGEIVLIERAFADAVNNLRGLPGFEDQLAQRLPSEELAMQRNAIIDQQRQTDPAKCQYSEEIRIIEDSGSVSGGYGMEENWINVPQEELMLDGEIVEDYGSTVAGYAVVEDGNVVQTIDGQIIGGEDLVVYEVEVIEPEVGNNSEMYENANLCIMEQPDYDEMGPENVYKVRTAVVSVTNAKGKKGVGLLISEQFVMTSADLIDRDSNVYALETINGKKLKARAFRINPAQNTALLVLDKETHYTPLSLNLELPAVDKENFMTLGLLNFTAGEGEGYLETGGKVSGYRYAADGTAQIVIDTFVQSVTSGGVLIDEKGRITGIAHTQRPLADGPDVFLPIETAMKSLGVEICGKAFPAVKPKPQKSWRQKSVAPLIENTVQSAPKVMNSKERK